MKCDSEFSINMQLVNDYNENHPETLLILSRSENDSDKYFVLLYNNTTKRKLYESKKTNTFRIIWENFLNTMKRRKELLDKFNDILTDNNLDNPEFWRLYDILNDIKFDINRDNDL